MSNDNPFDKVTDFGFQQVSLSEKTEKVTAVFHSVAEKYDLMNDLMSLGVHRLWKRYVVGLAQVRTGQMILDLAGGTGDLTKRMAPNVGPTGKVILCDINAAMLERGRDRLIDAGIVNAVDYVQANAEALPFPDNYFDTITIAFGLRNVTRKQQALEEMCRVLKPGGKLLILEFSHLKNPLFSAAYDAYSFNILPQIGQWVAGDADSYRYLAESIRRHPNQETLKQFMEAAGFFQCDYQNLSGGIVALHRGYKI
ncbi:MAG: bifunctional demethylmenaquinone methyltransferase/2-methoxy-6-polyprenyl-1,4-benzoquinol methylase UbiE [Gammaproteobacteria bacterium]